MCIADAEFFAGFLLRVCSELQQHLLHDLCEFFASKEPHTVHVKSQGAQFFD